MRPQQQTSTDEFNTINVTDPTTELIANSQTSSNNGLSRLPTVSSYYNSWIQGTISTSDPNG